MSESFIINHNLKGKKKKLFFNFTNGLRRNQEKKKMCRDFFNFYHLINCSQYFHPFRVEEVTEMMNENFHEFDDPSTNKNGHFNLLLQKQKKKK